MAKLEVTKNADGFFIRKGEKYSLSINNPDAERRGIKPSARITATEILLSEITGFYVSRELMNMS